MNVEDNLDSDNFYDFWQLSGCAAVLCHNVRHISKITTEKITAPVVSAVILNCSINWNLPSIHILFKLVDICLF